MTTPSQLSLNVESEQYITPGEQMIQKKPLSGDDDDSDHFSLTLDSQHTIKSGLTMETFLQTPRGKSVVKDRFAKHTVTAGINHKKAGEEKKKRSSRRSEYHKLDERQDPQRRSGSPVPALQDPRTVRGTGNSEERSRRRRASSVGTRENDKEVSSVSDVASISISVSDPCRKKERKKQSSSKEVKRSRSTDGSAGSSSKEGRRSQRIRSSSVVTTSKQEERESRKHRSKSRSPMLIPSNDAYPRIPDLDLDSKKTDNKVEASESFRLMKRTVGLQRTVSDPNLKPKVDAVFNSEKSTLKRLSTQKSRSLVSSLERSSGIGRSSYMPSLSPIHSEASSPVEDIVETIRKQLEAYASSHAPSQTQDAIVRMRLALDAMSSLLVDGSSRTEARTYGVSSSNGYFGHGHNPAHPVWLSPTPSQVLQQHHQTTSVSSGVPPVIVGTTGSCSSSSGTTSSRNQESFVRRWLPRQTSERIHRTMSRGRSDTTTSSNNNHNTNNTNIHLPLQTPERREVRQAQQELDQIQQRLEHDLDRLYHKWDELQQKQKELRRRSPTRL